MRALLPIILASAFLAVSGYSSFMRPCLTSVSVFQDCRRVLDRAAGSVIEQLFNETEECKAGREQPECKAVLTKLYMDSHKKCVLRKMGAMDEATGEIDLSVIKEATIGTSTLSDEMKQSAMATFDECMAAPLPSPWSPLHYKQEEIPERVRKVLSEMVKFLVIDQLIPTPRMVAIDCMNVALLHNGCIPSEEEMLKNDEDIQRAVQDLTAAAGQ